jgi:hypothetical protein
MSERKIIATNDLLKEDVPNPDRCSWHELSLFALTFDPEKEEDEKLKGQTYPTSNGELFELRSDLYFEQRRWNHFHKEPDRESMEKLREVLRRIYELLECAC